MNNIDLTPIYPEILLLITIVIILLIDMFLSDRKRVITYVSSLLALLLCTALTFNNYTNEVTSYMFHNMFVTDKLSNILKLFSYLIVSITFIYSYQYNKDYRIISGQLGGEFYILSLFSLLGQMIMISSNNFLSIYLGLELMSLSLYALAALRRDNAASTEAAIKYFVLGALASGFLLYGISILYGATGSLDINKIFRTIISNTINHQILIFGIIFIISGLAFKLGVVPFHMWMPDVYHGTPTSVTLLISATPKLAIFAIIFRLLIIGLLPLAIDWQRILTLLAIFSIILGNIVAITQKNIKRMLAYSTISHMGFMLLGILSGVVNNNLFQAVNAYSSSLFYIITYVITITGIFGTILVLSRSDLEIETLEDFKGLNKRSPLFAIIFLILLFSMAGIPPMVGFYAKFSVLQAVIGTGKIFLPILSTLFSVVGMFYYLRIVKLMYFDELIDNSKIVPNINAHIILSLNSLAVILLGLYPSYLMNISTSAIISALTTFLGKVIAI